MSQDLADVGQLPRVGVQGLAGELVAEHVGAKAADAQVPGQAIFRAATR